MIVFSLPIILAPYFAYVARTGAMNVQAYGERNPSCQNGNPYCDGMYKETDFTTQNFSAYFSAAICALVFGSLQVRKETLTICALLLRVLSLSSCGGVLCWICPHSSGHPVYLLVGHCRCLRKLSLSVYTSCCNALQSEPAMLQCLRFESSFHTCVVRSRTHANVNTNTNSHAARSHTRPTRAHKHAHLRQCKTHWMTPSTALELTTSTFTSSHRGRHLLCGRMRQTSAFL